MTTTIKHKPACQETLDRLARLRDEYERAWPRYCRACDGAGGGDFSYDPSPAGVALSPGCMYDCDTCERCVDRDRCPRCGQEMSNPLTKLAREWNDRVEAAHLWPWMANDLPAIVHRLWRQYAYPILARLTVIVPDRGARPLVFAAAGPQMRAVCPLWASASAGRRIGRSFDP